MAGSGGQREETEETGGVFGRQLQGGGQYSVGDDGEERGTAGRRGIQ